MRLITEEQNSDWESGEDGLMVARRSFLVRRGYCCGNRCRNCPYINWCICPTWQPIAVEQIKRAAHISPKSLAAARALLSYHQQQSDQCLAEEQTYHQQMSRYYCTLLERWGCSQS